MPLGQSQCISQTDPRGWVTPWFWHRLIAFRHFKSGLLALASLNPACRDHVPTFPQRSPPLLLTTAACGGLRSTPDCRPRRAHLHLSYSCAWPFGPATLVTQDPSRRRAFCRFRSIAAVSIASCVGAAWQPCLDQAHDKAHGGREQKAAKGDFEPALRQGMGKPRATGRDIARDRRDQHNTDQ